MRAHAIFIFLIRHSDCGRPTSCWDSLRVYFVPCLKASGHLGLIPQDTAPGTLGPAHFADKALLPVRANPPIDRVAVENGLGKRFRYALNPLRRGAGCSKKRGLVMIGAFISSSSSARSFSGSMPSESTWSCTAAEHRRVKRAQPVKAALELHCRSSLSGDDPLWHPRHQGGARPPAMRKFHGRPVPERPPDLRSRLSGPGARVSGVRS